jgi:hypothetical protein
MAQAVKAHVAFSDARTTTAFTKKEKKEKTTKEASQKLQSC